MAVDYDLVIIGETLEAREAAAIATRQGARVALVLSPDRLKTTQQVELLSQVLTHWGRRSNLKSSSFSTADTQHEHWSKLRQTVEMASEIAHPHLSPDVLAMQGVDVVTEAGYFSPKPKLAFTTEQRSLTARAYLLACGSDTVIPAIPGLAEAPYLTLETLLTMERLPQKLAILGRSDVAIALAQTFATLGTQVTLMTRGEGLLPNEDPDVAQFIEALLVATGVDLRLKAAVERVEAQFMSPASAKTIAIHLTPGDTVLAEQLLVSTGPQPAIETLNLDRVGVRQSRFGLLVNRRLQTTHPRIYAAGSVLGSSRQGAFSRHEAQIALHNALYLPTRSVHSRSLTYTIGTTPALIRVGLTETQARQIYSDRIEVYVKAFSESVKAHLLEEPIGFCKLVAHRNGQLLGASLVGPQASDLGQSLAFLISQKSHIGTLATFSSLPHTLTELLTQTAQQWQQSRWRHGYWRRDWAENWFNWRRSNRQ